MKTLIFIHGWESFIQEDDYQKFLVDTYIDWQRETWSPDPKTSWVQEIAKKWHTGGNQVFMPVLPNKQNARYRDWKIVFEWILSMMKPEDEITLIGWSLGGCFLLKYFSEVRYFGYKINQIHLLAACISEGDFTAPDNYQYLQQVASHVHVWHAEDDAVVPFLVGQELSRILPAAQTHFFTSEKWYGHFHGVEQIHELEEVIFS